MDEKEKRFMKKSTKRLFAAVLAAASLLALTACGGGKTEAPKTDDSKTEQPAETSGSKELSVYTAFPESEVIYYFNKFEQETGIKINYVRLSAGEMLTRVEAEKDNPQATLMFGGSTDNYIAAVDKGLLEAYQSPNLDKAPSTYLDPTGTWNPIYVGCIAFACNADWFAEKGLEYPTSWEDLLKPEFKGEIIMAHPATSGTAYTVLATLIQLKGEDAVWDYLKELDKNMSQYTKSGSGPSKMVGPGECVIAIGFLHDGIYQILQGYDNIQLIVPEDGTSFEVGATAILKGASHPNAAKLWIEYALSPDCVDHAKENGSYQFLVLKNATQPEEAEKFGLDMTNTIDYDFEDAKENSAKYVEDFFEALGSTSDGADSSRFLTE